MKIFKFIEDYCQDLIAARDKEKKLIDLSEFPNDGIITDVEGNQIPIVVVDGNDIPVHDFLTLDKAEFLKAYNTQNAEEAFDKYISALEILEGEEALSRIRMAISAERERLMQDVELLTEV